MTRGIQYRMPAKYTIPVSRPYPKARATEPASAAGTSSGTSAIQASAGWPQRGKLSASRAPEIAASTQPRCPGSTSG